MKLLLDQNLSHRIVTAVIDLFPESVHVRDVGLERADDRAVWDYAARQGFAIVSKDEDFHQRSFLYGQPPKVVWLRMGNCSTDRIISLLRGHVADLAVFDADPSASFLVIA